MKVIVDTDILVRMFTRDHPVESPRAEELLRTHDAVISNQTLCEMTWVLKKAYKFTAAELKQAVEALSGSETVIVDRGAVENGLTFMNAGGDFADGVIAFEGRRLGGEVFATFDRKAANILKRTHQSVLLLAAD
ncbi:type II toxin-antitoxin system VapC family toxin [Rhizobium sp. 32-5/1]|uniref:type II toxin-antitoxin system VapC family toxin n=1 Tax=Rhizobium sp. 32-5/1 TaxID=3019602 RepID=UPI00240E106D|nr:type II toxin-antitoxin system VapC family toxin [Rhizobium sp. 32-5/1]WEZ82933.1 type II toxin-antitoxin system VapC family toxin [Rhizobium sp. 32-5/1]